MRHLPLVLALAGCVQTTGPGPDLGACAEYPDGTWTFGQIGVGTCLAGPVDVEFVQRDGTSWLLVTNSDPFRNFTSGSLLAIDTSGFTLADDLIPLDTLDAYALPMESFVGAMALDGTTRAVVTSRHSPDAYGAGGLDRAWLVDVSDPRAMALEADRAFVGVRQDPAEVVVYDRKAWVLNPSDVAISVINLAAQPPTLFNPAPTSRVTDPAFTDVDASGSLAEGTAEALDGDHAQTTEAWTATFVDGTTRAWIPLSDGVVGFSSGGGDWVRSGFGAELTADLTPSLSPFSDLWLTFDGTGVVLHGEAGGVIRRAVALGGANFFEDPLVELSPSGWATTVAGPAVVQLGGRISLYFDGEDGDGAQAIGLASTSDGLTYTATAAPLITAPAGYTAVAQPSPILNPFTDTVRVWMSMYDGARWSIGLSSSADGLTGFSEPVEVLSLPGGDAGAPRVGWVSGRYRMFLTVREGGAWQHAEAWSVDGVTWSEPTVWLDRADLPPDETVDDDALPRPPRTAIELVEDPGWRLEGQQAGVIEDNLREGTTTLDTVFDLRVRVASGHEVGVDVLPIEGSLGVEPRSLVTVGVPTLYVTAWDSDAVPHLAALRRLGDDWGLAAWDLMPAGAGGNAGGAQAPVVFFDGATWRMLYGATDAGGDVHLRAATSDDGLVWTPDGADLLPTRAAWDREQQLPSAVTATADGFELWMSGFDGGRWTAGRVLSADGLTWDRADEPDIEPGPVGNDDDAGVRDVVPATCGGSDGVWYSAFDGATWRIGFATEGTRTWIRRVAPFTGLASSPLSALSASFAMVGVRGPVVDEASCDVLFAGSDGEAWRVGRAWAQGADLFPAPRFPTPGDTLSFATTRGEPGTSEIELRQLVNGAVVYGTNVLGPDEGPSVARVDALRGLMFLGAPGYPGVVVVDVRDDSRPGQPDTNYMGIETVLRFATTTQALGIRDLALLPDGRLLAAAREPDSVLVIDTSGIVDDDVAEFDDTAAIATLPVHDLTDDAGAQTFSRIGVAGLAWVPGQDLVLATHFRDNSVSVFDLRRGAAGEEIRYLPGVCESPSDVVVEPGGRYAVISCYIGAVSGDVTSSQLLLLDLRPESPTYLQITTRVGN